MIDPKICEPRKRAKRERLLAQQGGYCLYCGIIPVESGDPYSGTFGHAVGPDHATLDHVVPKSMLAGRGRPDNFVVACWNCNQERGDASPLAFWLQKHSSRKINLRRQAR